MAHDTTINSMSGGDTIVTVDLSLGSYPTGAGKAAAGVIYASANTSTAPAPVTNANPFPVSVQNATIAVTGTFFQTTQPVSAASLPLPTNAATETGGNLASLATAAGTTGDTAYAGTGSSSIVAALKGLYAAIKGSLTVAWTGSPNVTVANASIPVTGSFYQATQPVSLASLPALATGANAIGSITNTSFAATQSGTWTVGLTGAIPSGSNAIGSITNTSFGVTQATAASLNATVVGTGTFAVQATQSGTWNVGSISTLPALPAGSNVVGGVSPTGDVVNIAGTTYTVLKAFANATASGNTQVVALTSGKKIRVLKYTISANGAVNVYFNSSVAGAISSTKYLAGAGAGIGSAYCQFGHFDTTAGEALQINLSAAANVGVDVLYILV